MPETHTPGYQGQKSPTSALDTTGRGVTRRVSANALQCSKRLIRYILVRSSRGCGNTLSATTFSQAVYDIICESSIQSVNNKAITAKSRPMEEAHLSICCSSSKPRLAFQDSLRPRNLDLLPHLHLHLHPNPHPHPDIANHENPQPNPTNNLIPDLPDLPALTSLNQARPDQTCQPSHIPLISTGKATVSNTER